MMLRLDIEGVSKELFLFKGLIKYKNRVFLEKRCKNRLKVIGI